MRGALAEAEPGVLGFVSLLLGFVGFRRAAVPHGRSRVGVWLAGSAQQPAAAHGTLKPRAPRSPGKGRALISMRRGVCRVPRPDLKAAAARCFIYPPGTPNAVRRKLTAEATHGVPVTRRPRLGEGLREGPPAAPAGPRPRGRVSHQQGGAPRRAGPGRRSGGGGSPHRPANPSPADARGPAGP